MTRRIAFSLVALAGVAALLLLSGSPASAQLPFDLGALLRGIFSRFSSSPFFSFLSDIFGGILQRLTGNCAPFCAS